MEASWLTFEPLLLKKKNVLFISIFTLAESTYWNEKKKEKKRKQKKQKKLPIQ